MNKEMLDTMWDHFRQKYGVYLRVLDAFPADRLHSHLVSGMRTPAELAVHVSGSVVRDVAQGVAKGRITADESREAGVARGLDTNERLVSFAAECLDQASAAVAAIGDKELTATVTTPWNMTFPGWVGFQLMSDEFLHHRGQLYVYARLCGVTPPFMWSFGDNAPGYRPRESAETVAATSAS